MVRYNVTFPGGRVAVYEDGRWTGDPLAVMVAQGAEESAAARLRLRGGYVPDYEEALVEEVAVLGQGRVRREDVPPAPVPGRVY